MVSLAATSVSMYSAARGKLTYDNTIYRVTVLAHDG